jgi:hypothetical protein
MVRDHNFLSHPTCAPEGWHHLKKECLDCSRVKTPQNGDNRISAKQDDNMEEKTCCGVLHNANN